LSLLKIGEIKPEMQNIDVEGWVVEKGEKKEVMTRYGPAMVSWAILKDETGSIRVNLWRWQIDIVQVGDRIRLVNAFVKVFGERMELNIGANGKIVVLNRSKK